MFTPNQAASELEETSDEREQAARLYVDQLRAFYIHACMFAVGMLVIFAVNLLTNFSAGIAGDWTAWWSAWAFLGWGLGIAVHGLVVRLNRPTPSTPSWGQQQIDKVLSR
jgi:hypothetical protein